MSQLADTIAMLEKLGTPEAAAEAKKLKELDENFIPKSEFNKKNAKVQDALKAIKTELLSEITDEATRKLIEQLPDAESILEFRRQFYDKKKIESGKLEDLTKLLQQREAELETTRNTLKVDSKDAELYRKALKDRIEAIKTKMGDKWDENYAGLPLDALNKLAGVENTIVGSITGAPILPEMKTLADKLADAQKRGSMAEVVAIKSQMAAQQTS